MHYGFTFPEIERPGRQGDGRSLRDRLGWKWWKVMTRKRCRYPISHSLVLLVEFPTSVADTGGENQNV
jgi:hypothetical protein